MKKNSYILILIFSLILILPILDSVFHFSPIKELFEKRQPTSKPQFSWNKEIIINYPKNFEKFYDDNFGFRKTLIYLHSQIMDKVFDQSPSEQAVIGKNDWLFFNNNQSLIDVEGRVIYNQTLLDKGIEALYQNWKNLKKNNIDYVLVIAADKSTIYPEFLPDYIHPNGPSRLDQFLTRLNKLHPDFPIIDLRKSMLAAKNKQEIYYKTDTHWNKIGAYYGYLGVMNFLAKKHPELKPKSLNQFTQKIGDEKQGDIADIMNLKIFDVEHDLIPKNSFGYKDITTDTDKKQFHKPNFFIHKNQNLPILFSYKDSFMDNLMYFVSDHFSKSYYINEFPCNINANFIAKYQANIVIQEMWEGRMEEVLKSCSY